MTQDFEQLADSGLIVPKQRKKPERIYGALEIEDEENRQLAAEALTMLWDALELSKRGVFQTPQDVKREAWRQIYDYIGKMLLGEDLPEREVLC